MKTKLRIKSGDTVMVLSGKDKGKKGKVLAVNSDKTSILVEGVNMATKHKKPKKQGDASGIIHQEAPILVCKVMRICNKCGQPSRLGVRILDSGIKELFCKKCGDSLN